MPVRMIYACQSYQGLQTGPLREKQEPPWILTLHYRYHPHKLDRLISKGASVVHLV